jgi:hypothetical protein
MQHATPRRVATAIVLVAAVSLPPAASAFRFPAISIEAGGSSTDLQSPDYVQTHRIAGGTGGVAFDVHLGEQFSIEPGVLFVRRGARLPDIEVSDRGGNSLGTYQTYLTADYADVPVLGRFEPPTTNAFKPFAILGPRFGFKTAERSEARGSVSRTADSSLFEDFEFGVTVGGGMEYGIGRHRLVFDLRYDSGLTKHDDGQGGDFRTEAVLLMAGYVFHPEP